MTLVNGAETAANSEIAAVLFCAGLPPQCVICCVTWKGGKTDMGFFYKLFNGEICPIENLVRQTPEYTKALHELAAASEKLEKSLTPEQSDLFYAMKNAKAEVETLL